MSDIHVKLAGPGSIPEYGSTGAAGADLRAYLENPLTLAVGARALVPTGLHLEIPQGYEGQVRPRSGLAAKHGVTVANAPGTIDSDYRGEVKVILINLGDEDYRIEPGERVAQLVVAPVIQVTFVRDNELGTTRRGEGGFGSTGRR